MWVLVPLERWCRNALSWILGTFVPVRKISVTRQAELLQKNSSAKILLIRPHQGLGDLLLATPIFRALKKAYPSVQIHFLADTYNAIAIRNNRRLDKIWVWDKKRMRNPLEFWSFIRALRRERFTIALPLSSHIPSFTSYLIARLSGASAVWAYDTRPFYDGAHWSTYLAHVELPNRPETDPEWVKFMDLIRPLLPSRETGASAISYSAPVPQVVSGKVGMRDGVAMSMAKNHPSPRSSPLKGEEDYSPEFFIPEDVEIWAREEWRKLGLPATDQKKVGLFFGGNPDRPERLWPAAYWGDLAERLQKNAGTSLVAIVPPRDFLSGSRALERGVYGQVSPRLHPQPPLFSHSDLSRVAAFLKGLDLFVCVDGGLFHIAVGAGVRTLGLFFKTDPARWKPPVPWATVLRPADDLPASLGPEEVYQKICEMVLKSELERT